MSHKAQDISPAKGQSRREPAAPHRPAFLLSHSVQNAWLDQHFSAWAPFI